MNKARAILLLAATTAGINLATQARGQMICEDFTDGIDDGTVLRWIPSPCCPGLFTPTDEGLRFETNGNPRSAVIRTDEVFQRGVQIHARVRLDHPHFNIYFGDLVNFDDHYAAGSARRAGVASIFHQRFDPGCACVVHDWKEERDFEYSEELEFEFRIDDLVELRIWRAGERGSTDPIFQVQRQDDRVPVGNIGIQMETGTLVSLCVEEFPVKKIFRRGDTNGDGEVDVSDPINSLSVQFLDKGFSGCMDAMDFNDDGRVDVTDAIVSLEHLFLGKDGPPAPGKNDCGADPTPDNKNGVEPSGEVDDELGCRVYPAPSDPLDPKRQCD